MPDEPSPKPPRGLRFGGALAHRNYRLFFAGQSISLLGTWLTRFATVWMVYRLTKSPVMLGLVGFFGQAPAAVLAPVAGVLVDRWNRRRTVILTQVASMLQSAALAFFALTGTMTVWHLLVLGAVQAMINAFDTVSRQAFLGEMVVDRGDLPNAVALNSLMVNLAKMLGPVVAAALVPLVGEGWCFTADALSTLAVIASLVAMRVAPRAIPPRAGGGLRQMKAGLAYVAKNPPVRAVLALFAVTSVLVGAYATMLPLLAGGPLHGGAHTLGTLMGAAGCGALTGALVLAIRTGATRSGRVGVLRPVVANLGIGAALLSLELASSTQIAAPLLFAVGACLMVQTTSSSTIIQTTVDADKIGRVMSLYAIAFYAGAPIGALVEGGLAKLVGPVHMFAVAGAGCLISAFAFGRALRRRPRAEPQVCDVPAQNEAPRLM
jgi:MFS family permease